MPAVGYKSSILWHAATRCVVLQFVGRLHQTTRVHNKTNTLCQKCWLKKKSNTGWPQGFLVSSVGRRCPNTCIQDRPQTTRDAQLTHDVLYQRSGSLKRPEEIEKIDVDCPGLAEKQPFCSSFSLTFRYQARFKCCMPPARHCASWVQFDSVVPKATPTPGQSTEYRIPVSVQSVVFNDVICPQRFTERDWLKMWNKTKVFRCPNVQKATVQRGTQCISGHFHRLIGNQDWMMQKWGLGRAVRASTTHKKAPNNKILKTWSGWKCLNVWEP